MKKAAPDCPLILLCGGQSTRMGKPKGLLEVDGVPWFLHHIRHFRSSGGTHAVIVLGYHADLYLEALHLTGDPHGDSWKEYEGMQLSVTINQKPQDGQFSSIICGLRRIAQGPFPGAFILPVDMLSPGRNTWEALRNALTVPAEVSIPSWKGKGGHPVLLSGEFIRRLLSLHGSPADSRLDEEIKKLPGNSVRYIETKDNNVIGNVNTPDDFLSL